jgi:hypothetical protein
MSAQIDSTTEDNLLRPVWGHAESSTRVFAIIASCVGIILVGAACVVMNAAPTAQDGSQMAIVVLCAMVGVIGLCACSIGLAAWWMVYKWEHRQIARTKYDLRELPVAYATLYALTTSGAKYSFAKGHVEFPAVQFARPVRYMPGSKLFRGGYLVAFHGEGPHAAGQHDGLLSYIDDLIEASGA